MRRAVTGLAVAAALLAWLPAMTSVQAAGVFQLTSPVFYDNGRLAREYAGNATGNPNCVGKNISPPLSWWNPPEGTRSFALLMYDPEARSGLGFSHMVVYGIPATISHVAAGELGKPSDKYVGGKNGAGVTGYGGPCTSPGTGWHHYTLTLIATDLDPKALPPGLTREELFPQLSGHAHASAGLIGRFRHPGK